MPSNSSSPFSLGATWRRAVAVIIDIAFVEVTALYLGQWINRLFTQGITSFTTESELQSLAMQQQIAVIIMFSTLVILYFAGLPSLWNGKTLGKSLLNLRVVDSDGNTPDFANLLLRNIIGYFASIAVLFGGFIIAFFDEERRTLHDRLANTRVIKDEQ